MFSAFFVFHYIIFLLAVLAHCCRCCFSCDLLLCRLLCCSGRVCVFACVWASELTLFHTVHNESAGMPNAGSLPIWSSIWQSYVVLLLIFHKSIPFEVRLLDLCVLLFALPTVACGMCVLIESLNQFWRGVAREIVCGNRVAHYFLDGAKESRAWG